MAGISSTSLDVPNLVSQLIAAERAPYSLRFNRAEAGAKAKLSAFGSLTSAFNALKSAADALKNKDVFSARSAKSSDETVFTAQAAASVPTGSYSVEVLNLASAHKLVSGPLDVEDGLGAGTLQISTGGVSFSVQITSGSDTPAGIRDAINTAATAAGAKLGATLVTADDGGHLVFSASASGADSAITVTRTAGAVALDALVYDPGTLTSLAEESEALDAQIRVDGLLRSSTTNTVSDLLPGLTLTLKKDDPGVIKSLVISADGAATRNSVQAFVTAYNTAFTTMSLTTQYNSSTQTASTLTGDNVVRSASAQLRNAMGNGLAAAVDLGLGSGVLGLNTKTDGTLTFDASKFDAAFAADPAEVQAALSGNEGIAGKISTVAAGYIGSGGVFTSRTESLNKTLSSVAAQRVSSEARLASMEARFRTQFSALDSMIAKLSSTSDFLSRQLSIVI